MKKQILLLSTAVLLTSCGVTKTYTINAKSNTNTSGNAIFTEKNGAVTMKLVAENLSPGIHAIHIHEKGDCSASDASSAGGHWNPMKEMHGKWGHGEFHNGDIGNLVADESGKATLTFKTDRWCLTCNDDHKNIIGKAIIIHKSADDFSTQPTGNAGGRIGCVEIK
jgi:Cu-Zn family superoxide dismutase